MKLLCSLVVISLTAVVLAAPPKDGAYLVKHKVNLDEVLESDRLLSNYFNCLTDAGTCTAAGLELKSMRRPRPRPGATDRNVFVGFQESFRTRSRTNVHGAQRRRSSLPWRQSSSSPSKSQKCGALWWPNLIPRANSEMLLRRIPKSPRSTSPFDFNSFPWRIIENSNTFRYKLISNQVSFFSR